MNQQPRLRGTLRVASSVPCSHLIAPGRAAWDNPAVARQLANLPASPDVAQIGEPDSLPIRSRILLLAGPSGSGKSEISANLALSIKAARPVVLADLDIIKPLFRLRNARADLERFHVYFISPGPSWDVTDLPVLPSELGKWLSTDCATPAPVVIIDLGGDGAGTRAIAQYKELFREETADLLFVVNPYRPFSRTVTDLESQVREIERNAGMPTSGLVSNPHLKEHTSFQTIMDGHAIAEELARRTSLPISFIAARKDLAKVLRAKVNLPILALHLFIKPPWEQFGPKGEGESC